MINCSMCHQGTVEERLVDTWKRQGERWVLLHHVPAWVCDVCGDTTYSEETAELLAWILSPGAAVHPTEGIYCPVYDIKAVKRVHEAPLQDLRKTSVDTAIGTRSLIASSS